MGKRGPQPQPKALALQKGVYRPSRHGEDLSNTGLRFVSQNDYPYPPDGMDKLGVDLWNEKLAQVAKVGGWIAYTDLTLLERYCSTYVRLKQVETVLDRMGNFIEDDKGNMKTNPALTELLKIEKLFKDMGDAFGFSPSARTRVKLEQPEKEQEEEFRL